MTGSPAIFSRASSMAAFLTRASSRTGALGASPGYVIHNIGNGAREELALFAYPLTGRYRWALNA